MLKKITNNLKFLKLKDVAAIFIFILVIIPAMIYKLYLKLINKKLYLICEDPNEARDNGYHLFKYIRLNYPKDNFYYAIYKKSNDYKKISSLGNVIEFGSLKHWVFYLSATKNISTHKYGNPNPPLFYVLHVILGFFNNRIFLQHGITQNDSPWLYYKNTKFKTIICAAKPEYNFIKTSFGYPEENVKYLGFPRFDNLDRAKINKKQIVIMPTWRNWLGRTTNNLGKKETFTKTEFFKKYNELLNNQKLIEYIEKKDLEIYFFPHRNMQKFINDFHSKSQNIKIVSNNNIDIQDLIIESALMITDYSSVAMDFVYMRKPVIYYQFDKKEFREKQLQEGYFSYEDDGFGEVVSSLDTLIADIIKIADNDFKIESKYKKRVDSFFELNDKNNCKRVYDFIRGE